MRRSTEHHYAPQELAESSSLADMHLGSMGRLLLGGRKPRSSVCHSAKRPWDLTRVQTYITLQRKEGNICCLERLHAKNERNSTYKKPPSDMRNIFTKFMPRVPSM